MNWIVALAIGLLIGANAGLFVLALLVAAGEADERGVGE